MRNNLVILSLVAALTLMASFGFAGSGVAMRVSVPFDFYAGDQLMKAGEYVFEMGSGFHPTGAVVSVRSNEGQSCILTTRAGSEKNSASHILRFNRYGDKTFLSSIEIQGFKAGVKPMTLERELRTQAHSRQQLALLAEY